MCRGQRIICADKVEILERIARGIAQFDTVRRFPVQRNLRERNARRGFAADLVLPRSDQPACRTLRCRKSPGSEPRQARANYRRHNRLRHDSCDPETTSPWAVRVIQTNPCVVFAAMFSLASTKRPLKKNPSPVRPTSSAFTSPPPFVLAVPNPTPSVLMATFRHQMPVSSPSSATKAAPKTSNATLLIKSAWLE